MTIHSLRLCVAAAGLTAAIASAGPGAHGPTGEHLDNPTEQTGAAAGSPRSEAQSDLFEMVATLRGGELSLLIDRYASNEPVLNAQVEVESGALKAKAAFQADSGDYVVEDPALVKALGAPGEHTLVVTIVAGTESDLLDATLVTAGHDSAAAEKSPDRTVWIGAAALAVASIGVFAWLRRRRRANRGTF